MPLPPTRTAALRKVFVSYTHADYDGARVLLKWLKQASARLGIDAPWVDFENVRGGDEWRQKILPALEAADLFIVLMSIDFLDSRFCREVEFRRIMERRAAAADKVRLIGVFWRKVAREDFRVTIEGVEHRLDELQCLPQSPIQADGERRLGPRAIRSWPDDQRDEAWDMLIRQLEQAIRADMSAQPTLTRPPAVDSTLSASPQALQAGWLPYLANRSDQCVALDGGLAGWIETRHARPLLVLTEGRSEDCLTKWVDRLQLRELGRGLGLGEADERPTFGHCKAVGWPRAAGSAGSDVAAAQYFVRALAASQGLSAQAAIDDVVRSFVDRQRPTLLWMSCSDLTPPAQALRALRGLLWVLARWPALSPATMLVVAINLDRPTRSAPAERAALGAEFESVLQQAADSGDIRAVGLGSLPELDEFDIAAWGQNHAPQRWQDADTLLVGQYLGTSESAAWPMREFAAAAGAWLKGDPPPTR